MKKQIKLQQDILTLVKKARTNRTSKDLLSIGKITKFQADIFEKRLGINVRGYERIITAEGVRHALKHININDPDFLAILLIVENPDMVGLGKKQNTIVYRKDFDKFYFYVECVQKRKNRLIIQTLYKRKKPLKRT
jgi:hypothetical protein